MIETALLKFLPWDSAFFGKRIGQVLASPLKEDEFREAIRMASAENLDCLYFLCDSADPESAGIAESNDFHLVDIRVTKEVLLSDKPGAEPQWDQTRVRLALPGDLPALKAIAGVAHTYSRFYYDRNFDRSRASELFELWIEKSCNGWAQAVFAAVHQGRAVGYLSCHQDEPRLGRIGLAAVGREAQGRGVGTALMQAALAWFRQQGVSRATVVTQGRNIGAQRLYEQSGFVTSSIQLWYHGWKPFGRESLRR